MVDANANLGKKRSLTYMNANELTGKLRSKADFLAYLDKHRKYRFILILTSLQCSITFQTPTS